MIIEAKEVNGVIEPKHEIKIKCANCGMEVDDVEYTQGTCNDCGEPWKEARDVAIHVTSIPLFGDTM